MSVKLRPTGIVIESVILATITSVSMLIRILPGKFGITIGEFDPWYEFYLASHLISSNLNWYSLQPDTLSWYPWSIQYNLIDQLGVSLLLSFITYMIKAITGIGVNYILFTVSSYFGVVIEGLLVISTYLVVRDLIGKYGAMIASLIVAFSPSLIVKNSIGGLPKPTLGAVFLAFALFFIIRGIKNRNLWHSIPSAIMTAFVPYTWGGGDYVFLSIAITNLLVVAIGKNEVFLTRFLTYWISFSLLLVSLAPWEMGFFSTTISLLLLASLLILHVDIALRKILREKIESRAIITLSSISLFLVLAFSIILITKHSDFIPSRYYALFIPYVKNIVPAFQTVAEYAAPSILQLIGLLGTSTLLSIIGVIYIISKKRDNYPEMFILLLSLTSLLGLSIQTYLANYTVIPLAMVAGLGFGYLMDNIKKINYRSTGKLVALGLVLFSTGFALVADAGYSIVQANTPLPIVASGLPLYLSSPNYGWVYALNYLTNYTPKDAVIVAWWDYGYWITVIANRTTLDNNNTVNGTQIRTVAKMFLNNETVATSILENNYKLYPSGSQLASRPVYVVSYEVITISGKTAEIGFPVLIPFQSGYIDVGIRTTYGDIAKAPAMMTWLGYNFSDYLNQSALLQYANKISNQISSLYGQNIDITNYVSQSYTLMWTNKMLNSLLGSMMIEGLQSIGYNVYLPGTTIINQYTRQITGSIAPPIHLNYFKPVEVILSKLTDLSNGVNTESIYVAVFIFQFTTNPVSNVGITITNS